MMQKSAVVSLVLLCGVALSLSACSGVKSEAKYPTGMDRSMTGDDNIYSEGGSILGDDGFKVFGKRKTQDMGSVIGVNSYLWRATIDTLSFMPMTSLDPFGGAVLTDWYTEASSPNERMKVNAFITTKELSANGVDVKVFRQVKRSGSWVDVAVSEETSQKLEDAILTRAREMRIAKLGD